MYNILVPMRHSHAPESNYFSTKFLEPEHVLDVFKIEGDIKNLIPLNSIYIRMVWFPNPDYILLCSSARYWNSRYNFGTLWYFL